jgi:hypothetical protein
MQIGDPSYKKCPNCGKKIEYHSGPFFVNYYGLTEWSDGEKFQELPSLEKTKLQKCCHCNSFYWFSQMLGGMSFYEYYDALLFFEQKYSQRTIINIIFRKRIKKRLMYIRLMILRSFNNRIRIHPLQRNKIVLSSIPEKDKIIFLENARELINLLKEIDAKNYFLIAELYRNLGLFEESKIQLNKFKNEHKKRILLNEIEKKNRDVVIVEQPEKASRFF